MSLDPNCRCGGRLVNVRAVHRNSRFIWTGTSNSVVEDEHSVGPGNVLQQQVVDFGIMTGLDGFVVYEIRSLPSLARLI